MAPCRHLKIQTFVDVITKDNSVNLNLVRNEYMSSISYCITHNVKHTRKKLKKKTMKV